MRACRVRGLVQRTKHLPVQLAQQGRVTLGRRPRHAMAALMGTLYLQVCTCTAYLAILMIITAVVGVVGAPPHGGAHGHAVPPGAKSYGPRSQLLLSHLVDRLMWG